MFSLPSLACSLKDYRSLILNDNAAKSINTMKQTPDPSATLEAIRTKIDGIDEALHCLMIERTALAAEVWQAKDRSVAGLAALRPAREAQMLRLFAETHRGEMPLPVLWRIWRELIIANIRAQSPFKVHVAGGGHETDGRKASVWDLARAHYCFDTSMTRQPDAQAALAAAKSEKAVAVLPAANIAEWADELTGFGGIRIFDALPRIVGSAQVPEAFLVGDVALEASGEDTSVALVNGDKDAAVAAASEENYLINYVQPAKGMTLIGVNGIVAADLPQDSQIWNGIDVRWLGAHTDALVGPASEGD